jgi:hypothetical protein
MNLDTLAQLHANHCDRADGYATSTHAGVAAVLREVANDARDMAAGDLTMFAAKLDKLAMAPMTYPTITTLPIRDGTQVYRVEIPGLRIEHGQAWQAEALFQQQAHALGIELPAEWFERRLGERSRPAA